MAILTSCWFIIESIVIPDGFLKWFYLSFYVHPLLLLVCQIFLWFKLLQRWLIGVISHPIRIVCFVGFCVYRFLKICVVRVFSSTGLTNVEVLDKVVQSCNENQVFLLYSSSIKPPTTCSLAVFELQQDKNEEASDPEDDAIVQEDEKVDEPVLYLDQEMSMNEFLASVSVSNSSPTDENYPSSVSSNSPVNDLEMMDQSSSFVCRSDSPDIEREVINGSDAFYKKYTERMRWFDVLNYDRTYGISAILNKQLGAPTPPEITEPEHVSVPYVSWNKMAKRRLLKSLESDFELVYVGQSCLSWEALHNQYRKVEALACSSSQNREFDKNVAGEFQKFQVLLERFMEDERCEGKRIWNYVRGRFSLKSLLQVPEVSGLLVEEKGENKGEAMNNIKEVLKAIENCIQAFWVFAKTDNKKQPWWKLRTSIWTCPPVEDPRDLELLADLTNKLQKKELWLKDSQGKQRCWLKRVVNHPVEESQRKEMIFTMIDMKLVSRVLQMSVVSSSQLKWCHEKLDNINFKEGKIMRATSSGPLFPPS